MYRLAINVMGGREGGGFDLERLRRRLEAAEEGGVHSVWSGEAWGTDAFTPLVLAAAFTRRVQIGTAIVNVFSRTPAALAQHFVTLDAISGGRAMIGLGTSGAQVIEHFHGVPFGRGLRRLREYIDIINMLVAGEPLHYAGEIFRLGRGFTLRFRQPRAHIPILLASLTPASVRLAARHADGWLPIWIPTTHLAAEIGAFRATATRAGRDPAALIVRSPGVIVLTRDVERARRAARGNLAFYIARMGVFYYQNLSRMLGEEAVAPIKAAWDAGGSAAGAEAVPEDLSEAMTFVTDSVEAARERLAQQQAAGVDIHQVSVDADTPEEQAKLYDALAR
jgi:alkanesulfonate monooxygenase SsuD/methylene tetrahydromethanopterin reductase-like flavin-dependent oxidoreductase (luciferase family)